MTCCGHVSFYECSSACVCRSFVFVVVTCVFDTLASVSTSELSVVTKKVKSGVDVIATEHLEQGFVMPVDLRICGLEA